MMIFIRLLLMMHQPKNHQTSTVGRIVIKGEPERRNLEWLLEKIPVRVCDECPGSAEFAIHHPFNRDSLDVQIVFLE